MLNVERGALDARWMPGGVENAVLGKSWAAFYPVRQARPGFVAWFYLTRRPWRCTLSLPEPTAFYRPLVKNTDCRGTCYYIVTSRTAPIEARHGGFVPFRFVRKPEFA
jgi:hypothetical protein